MQRNKIEMPLTSILGGELLGPRWRDSGIAPQQCEQSLLQLQLLLFYQHHLLLEGSLSLQLALYPPQNHQFLPLKLHQRLACRSLWEIGRASCRERV